MSVNALLNEAEEKLRIASGMIRAQGDPAAIVALAQYAGACATLAGVRINNPGQTQEQAEQLVQETLDAEKLPQR